MIRSDVDEVRVLVECRHGRFTSHGDCPCRYKAGFRGSNHACGLCWGAVVVKLRRDGDRWEEVPDAD